MQMSLLHYVQKYCHFVRSFKKYLFKLLELKKTSIAVQVGTCKYILNRYFVVFIGFLSVSSPPPSPPHKNTIVSRATIFIYST